MNNGDLHEILADLVAKALTECGFVVRADAGVPGGYVDRLATLGDITVAVEIERKPDRVLHDVQKAAAIGAELLIVCPTAKAVAASRRKLKRSGIESGEPGEGIGSIRCGQQCPGQYREQYREYFRGHFRGRVRGVWVLTPAAARAWVYERFRP